MRLGGSGIRPGAPRPASVVQTGSARRQYTHLSFYSPSTVPQRRQHRQCSSARLPLPRSKLTRRDFGPSVALDVPQTAAQLVLCLHTPALPNLGPSPPLVSSRSLLSIAAHAHCKMAMVRDRCAPLSAYAYPIAVSLTIPTYTNRCCTIHASQFR